MALSSVVSVDPAVAGASPGATPHEWPSRPSANYSLFVVTIVCMFTILDRQILALMIEPIKAEFHISDTKAALLLGAAFSLSYAFAGLPISRLADRGNRRNVVAGCIAFWSAATVATGLAQNYAHLVLARLGIGIGESGYGPASWSILGDSFPREKFATALAVMSIGVTLGSGLALFLGGAVLRFVEHFPAMPLPFGGVIRPWQWAFVIVGAPGLLWALVVLTIKEPARRGVAKGTKVANLPVREVARFMRNDWRVYLAVIGGLCVNLLQTAGVAQWMPSFYHREFGWSVASVGLITGGMALVISPIALVIGGKISEWWIKRGQSDANLRIVLYTHLFTVPAQIVQPLLPSPWMVLALGAVVMFVTSVGTGPAVSSIQITTPNRMRAQVASVSQFMTNVVAFALGPLIVALFTDFLFSSPSDLKYSIALCSGILGPLGLLLTYQGLKPFARAFEREAALERA